MNTLERPAHVDIDWLRPEDIASFVDVARANPGVEGELAFCIRVQLLAHMPWVHWHDVDQAAQVILALAKEHRDREDLH